MKSRFESYPTWSEHQSIEEPFPLMAVNYVLAPALHCLGLDKINLPCYQLSIKWLPLINYLLVLDSIGRPLVSGFAEGIQSDFGEYTECLGIISPKSEEREIRGQYCLMNAIMPFPPISSVSEADNMSEGRLYSGLLDHYGLGQLASVRAFVESLNLSNGTIYRMGICIPSQCSAHEFQHLLNACKCCRRHRLI